MSKLLPAALFLMLQCIDSAAQTSTRQLNNALSLELGKSGLIFNASFDHRFNANPFGVRFAAGSNGGSSTRLTTIGSGFYWLAGKSKRLLELGADFSYLKVKKPTSEDDQIGFGDMIGKMIYPSENFSGLYMSLNLGYRSYGSKSLFRIGLSPGIAGSKFIPGGYIGIGARF